MRKFLNILIVFALSAFMQVSAQVSVSAELDSAEIFVGEQAHVHVKVSASREQNVVFPLHERDILTPGVEIVKASAPDTIVLNDGSRMTIERTYTITSFEDSLYYLPPFRIMVDSKEYTSKSLALKVLTIPVDTLHPDIFAGPKEIVPPLFSWEDWKGVFFLSLLWLAVVAVLAVLLLKQKSVRVQTKLVVINPPLPAHEEAIKEIERLKGNSDLDPKEYYTMLTDVLRNYISRRFDFNALEMTSDEIIGKLLAVGNADELRDLRNLLQTADLVKFAKYSTGLSENDRNLMRAVEFVDTTKDNTPVQPIVQRVSIEEKEIRRKVWSYRIAVIATALVAAALTWYVFSELAKLIL